MVKKLAKKDFFQKIKDTQDRLIYSLARAWGAAPNDPIVRKKLLRAMAKALQLREKIYLKILKEKPGSIPKMILQRKREEKGFDEKFNSH